MAASRPPHTTMKQHARSIILVLALLGLFASVGSLYVHYQVLQDPNYQSFCDINETVSCEALYQSQYGTAASVLIPTTSWIDTKSRS